MLDALSVANDDVRRAPKFVMRARTHHPALNGLRAELPDLPGAFEAPLIQGADHVSTHLQRPQSHL